MDILVLTKREEEFSDRLNNRATFQGFTALHYAVLADSETCVKALLDRGANPTIENEAGHRAVEYAKEGEIKEMLVKHAIKYDEIVKEKVCNKTLFYSTLKLFFLYFFLHKSCTYKIIQNF